MLDGWYCRTMANEQAAAEQNDNDDENDGQGDSGSDDDSHDEGISRINQKMIDYKIQHNNMKKKLKFLLYENEFFQDALRSSQRRLLKVTRDKSFLLERLIQYEKPDLTTSESDETETSDDDAPRPDANKRKKFENSVNSNSQLKQQNAVKRKKPPAKKQNFSQMHGNLSHVMTDGHMTTEEVERHLQSRQSLMELVPEKAPPTVPNEMFSNEPSLDSESNDQMIETSPSNIGEDCLSVDMNIIQD